MKKYLETSKLLFKTQIVYRFDTIVSMIFTVSKILLAYVLWSAIFEDNVIIKGFTFTSMISYYIISSFITQLDMSHSTGEQIAFEIRHGTFSKYMVRPINVFGYFLSQTLGVSAFLLIFNLIAAIVWVFVFSVNLTISNNLIHIILSIIIIGLGLLFMMQLNFFIGILAFKFQEISVFMMVKDNVMQFIIGSLIPLSILPSILLDVMRYFPFYYVTYLPSMVLIGTSIQEIPYALIILSIWNLLFLLLNKTTYHKLRIKYDGVGI